MPQFSKRSRSRLLECHHDLQRLFNEVIRHVDITILCGHRNREDQNRAFAEGKSRLQWPNSLHNKRPALAVDVAPWPLDWEDIPSFTALSAVVKECAQGLGIEVVWGGDWVSFRDYPHWQLKTPK